MEQFCYTIAPDQDGQRVDSFLASLTGRTRSQIQHYMEQGLVTIENRTAAKNSRVKTGQTVVISVPDPVELEACPQEIPVEILYEDDCVLVVNKPKGMVVHPAPGNPDGTLVNALLWHCKGHLSSINGVIRPGIVHRIDRDTSGLLLVAKTDQAHLSLSAQIAAHSCERVYQAVVYGRMKSLEGTVDAPIGRHPVERKQMCVGNRPNPSNSCPYGVHWPSAGRRSGLWPQEGHSGTERPMPSCEGNCLYTSGYRRTHAV